MGKQANFSVDLAEAVAGKRILLTGASSGIGLAMAKMLAPTSAELHLVARSEDKLNAAKAEVLQLGGRAHIHPCDLSDDASANTMIDTIKDEFGGIDILINNAGRSIRRRVTESYDRLHDYRRTMELNYFASIRLILAFLPGMKERGSGQVVNILTMGCQFRTPRFSAYIASKLALDAASRCIAAELKDQNIALSQVYLPLVRTPMIAPTQLYSKVAAMDVESAAERSLTALITGQPRVMMPLGVIAELMHLAAPDLSQRLLNKTEQDELPPMDSPIAKFGEKVLNWLAYGSEQS